MSECARCGGTVYAADRVQALDREWHKACMTCDKCTGKLNPAIPGLLVPVDGRPFCSKCAKGAAAAPASPAAQSPAPAGGSNAAPVWAAAASPGFFKPVATEEPLEEEVVAVLEKTPAPEERPQAEEGPEGGVGSLASKFGTLHTATGTSSPKAGTASPKAASGAVLSAQRAPVKAVSPEGTPKLAVWAPPQPPPLPPPPQPKAAPVSQATHGGGKAAALAKLGGGVPCARCGKSVYAAERVLGPGGDWHKICLTCASCKRSLVAGGWLTAKSDAYCVPCHGKLQGGARTSTTTG